MKLLVSIDSTVGKDLTLTAIPKDSIGTDKENSIHAGSERAVNLGIINKHYHALGSYLHVPTINKIHDEKDNSKKRLRSRCDKVAAHIDGVLASSVWNVDFKNTCTHACQRCETTIVSRRNKANEEQVATCWECGARYKLVAKPESKIEWEPDQVSFNCLNESYQTPYFFWSDEVKVGASWVCDDCGQKWVFAFGTSLDTGQPLYNP